MSKGHRKHKSEKEKAKDRLHTARNKIRRIELALKTAKGKAIDNLKERLKFWRLKL